MNEITDSYEELYDLTKKIAVLTKTVDEVKRGHTLFKQELEVVTQRLDSTSDVTVVEKESKRLRGVTDELRVVLAQIDQRVNDLINQKTRVINSLSQETMLFKDKLSEASKKEVIDKNLINMLQEKNKQLITSLKQMKSESDKTRGLRAQVYKKIDTVLDKLVD